jgi:hypothetical protein
MIELESPKKLGEIKLNIGDEVLDKINVIKISQLLAMQLKTHHAPLGPLCWTYSLPSLQRVIVNPDPGNVLCLNWLCPEGALRIGRAFNTTNKLEVDLPTVSDILKALEEQGAAGQRLIEVATHFFGSMMSMEDKAEEKGWFYRGKLA